MALSLWSFSKIYSSSYRFYSFSCCLFQFYTSLYSFRCYLKFNPNESPQLFSLLLTHLEVFSFKILVGWLKIIRISKQHLILEVTIYNVWTDSFFLFFFFDRLRHMRILSRQIILIEFWCVEFWLLEVARFVDWFIGVVLHHKWSFIRSGTHLLLQ